MKKLFGTDGIRAVAGQSPLDAKTVNGIGLSPAHLQPQHRLHAFCSVWILASPATGSLPLSPRAS